jgi:para-nitrobenzyl esterase
MTAKNIHKVFTKDALVFKNHSIKIEGITYKGFQSTADTPIQFRGLPFGTDTYGKNRFNYAELYTPNSKEIDSTKYGPACWQNPIGVRKINEGLGVLLKEGLFPSTKKGSSLVYDNFSEDCLNLNLLTPNFENEKRPVMVWIHGGAF